MNVKLVSNTWQWDIDKLDIHSPVIYKSHLGLIYILFQKQFDHKRRHDILCYLDYIRVFNYGKIIRLRCCTFCAQYKPSIRCHYNGEYFGVCDDCINIKSDNYFIYTNYKFHDSIQTVEYILYHQNRYYFFYHIIVNEKDFNYPTIIHQPWFQITKDTLCSACHQQDKYYNSWCKGCYDFAYDEFFKHHLCKHDLINQLLLSDLANIIMNQYLALLNINICCELLGIKRAILDLKENAIHEKHDNVDEESDEILETDLITEDNVDTYLEEDFYDDELGTWSDE